MYEQSETIDKLAGALAKAQGQFEGAEKSRSNTHLNSRYSTLTDIWAAIRKPLSENGLFVGQFPSMNDGKLTVITQITHESGQWMRSALPMPLPAENKGVSIQQVYGSVISYAKRYALGAALGIVSEDDDDGDAGKNNAGRNTPKPQPPQSNNTSAASGKEAVTKPQIARADAKPAETKAAPTAGKGDSEAFKVRVKRLGFTGSSPLPVLNLLCWEIVPTRDVATWLPYALAQSDEYYKAAIECIGCCERAGYTGPIMPVISLINGREIEPDSAEAAVVYAASLTTDEWKDYVATCVDNAMEEDANKAA